MSDSAEKYFVNQIVEEDIPCLLTLGRNTLGEAHYPANEIAADFVGKLVRRWPLCARKIAAVHAGCLGFLIFAPLNQKGAGRIWKNLACEKDMRAEDIPVRAEDVFALHIFDVVFASTFSSYQRGKALIEVMRPMPAFFESLPFKYASAYPVTKDGSKLSRQRLGLFSAKDSRPDLPGDVEFSAELDIGTAENFLVALKSWLPPFLP